MTVEVSVVMSVFNGAATLAQTLASVLAQDGCELEFIVVDDGSTDGSGAVLDEWAARDARLRVLHQANAGLTRALAAGCAAARGRWIARQDAGDVSLPGRLAKQLEAMKADPSLSFTACATRFVDASGAFLFAHEGTGHALIPTHVIDLTQANGVVDGPSHHGAVMFRRDAYEQAGGYRPQFYFGQDWDLWYRLAELGKFQALRDVLYEATIGVGDISATQKPHQEALATLSRRALELRQRGEGDEAVLREAERIRPVRRGTTARQRAAAAYFLGECLRRNRDHALARRYFIDCIRAWPLHVPAWIRLCQSAFAPASDGA
jgi:glycosyltransferase involved in cell wall biosynthesis